MRNRERIFAEVMEFVSQLIGKFQLEILVEHLSTPMLLVLSGTERHVQEIAKVQRATEEGWAFFGLRELARAR